MVTTIVKPSAYYDSVTLMLLTRKISTMAGVEAVAVMMGTEHNKTMVRGSGLLDHNGEKAGANDLIIGLRCVDQDSFDQALKEIEVGLLPKTPGHSDDDQATTVKSLVSAASVPGANLALISLPGLYAVREARKALELGLNVFLFSDNVPVEDEVRLKQFAVERGLLVMGPDCGTAYINGIGIGFANEVRKGDIGLVAASGTGMQEVVCRIDSLGGGITHAIGTGGRDVKQSVGGITMLQGIDLLAKDEATKVIVIVSKPPASEVEAKVLQALQIINKPIVLCLLGGTVLQSSRPDVHVAQTLEEAALMAVALSKETSILDSLEQESLEIKEIARGETAIFMEQQQYVRGLFTGGTLCYESLVIFDRLIGDVHSNVPLHARCQLPDPRLSVKHSFIDLGDDEFTNGRPHPMMDPAARSERLLLEAHDDSVAVFLLDVVLGYGSHPDPAGELAVAVEQARHIAGRHGRRLCFIASVCGTDKDWQNMREQTAKLEQAGILVMRSNAEASYLAARIAKNLQESAGGKENVNQSA